MQVGIHDDDSKRCSLDGCPQFDLLASKCSHCGDIFCSEHTPASAHNCKGFNSFFLYCPVCKQQVPLEFTGQSPDDAVSRHIDRGCRPAYLSASEVQNTKSRLHNNNNNNNNNGKERMNYCSYDTCTKNEYALIICEDCRNMYCIEHRAPARHKCRAKHISPSSHSPQSTPSPAAAHASPLQRSPRNTPYTAFGKKTEGAVTPLIFFAEEFGVTPFYMHFSRTIVMGRVLDLAVAQGALESSRVNSEKGPWILHILRQSDHSSGVSVFSPRLSATLQEEGVIDNIILYISKQQVLPKRLVNALVEHSNKKRRKSGKNSSDCSLM